MPTTELPLTTFTPTRPQPATPENPLGLAGIAFVEFAGPNPAEFERVFRALGFSRTRQHATAPIDYYNQNHIHFLVNHTQNTHASAFAQAHGQSAPGLGFWVHNAQHAFDEAVRRGAKPFSSENHPLPFPAIYGLGDSLLYFVDAGPNAACPFDTHFVPHTNPVTEPPKGFLFVDHLTNNVHQGTRDVWATFYKDVFGFTEIQYFDIRGAQTGLTSFALKSPCKGFSIPINEGTEAKSQIEEYLREYNGPGIQHIALASTDLLNSLDQLAGCGIQTLDIDDEYYKTVFTRVPNVREDHTRIQHHQVLVDGNPDGYLLQIFTQNLFGPIFFELIQRANNDKFGEGNFGALFKSIERDQARRGVL